MQRSRVRSPSAPPIPLFLSLTLRPLGPTLKGRAWQAATPVSASVFSGEITWQRERSQPKLRDAARPRASAARSVGKLHVRSGAVKARRVVRRVSARVKAKSAVRKASRKAKRTVRKAARSARRNIRVAKRGARSAIRGTARNVRAATRKVENVANKLVSATAEKVESAAVAVDQSMAEPRPIPVSVAA